MEADEFGCRKFSDVEFPASDHTVEDIAAGIKRNAGEIDTLDCYVPLADRLHAIIATTRKCQMKARHGQPRRDSKRRRRISAWRTGSCGGPWPYHISCARPHGNRA